MADVLEDVQQGQDDVQSDSHPPLLSAGGFMQKFRLYETRSKFYMVGRDKTRTFWKILKIDRLEPSELSIREDSATYTERECSDLLRRIHEGNRATGGLKFVATCYGIVGFIKFLGPYYMLLITKRRRIGSICGHNVYAISKTEMIPLPNAAIRSNMVNYKNENRYKKLLCMVDLTKDFYFSYSYNVMRSLQKNMCDGETGQVLYETMFVWNEYLTRGIRNILQNTLWTVALVYGFFQQATLPISGRNFKLTLMARRSRHYAGTRYLKRGVNEKGRVANDVETEQILIEDVSGGIPLRICSVVQHRGSIPLLWSQETSRLNIKPDIILSNKDQLYSATRLHFENLVKRYGNPIIILNLIKTKEKKPRESILRAEFANAIEVINKDLSEEKRLKFVHLDLHKHLQRYSAEDTLGTLAKMGLNALALTGFFYCQASPEMLSKGNLNCPSFESPMFQKGVLRTNCIDCLDRTNVAQYAYGLVALGHQLHALGVTTTTNVELDDPLAEVLMGFYERMGDTLAYQYGGSAAHNKIFSAIRGQWKAATQSQEFFRTLQRYYSNAYMDTEKQNAINVFLGHFQPQPDKPDVWELDSDQHYNVGRNGQTNIDGRSLFKRSWSDGSILHERQSPTSTPNINRGFPRDVFSNESKVGSGLLSESITDIPTSKSEYSRRTCLAEMQRNRYLEHENGDTIDCSNFVDLDWLSSSGNSCEEELLERSMLTVSPTDMLSSENIVKELIGETTPSTSECGSSTRGRQHTGTDMGYGEALNDKVLEEFSERFVRWVTYGEALCQ